MCGVLILVLYVMRVVGGDPLWVECVFRRVDVCRCVFVSYARGNYMVKTYSSMGLAMALYVAMIVSFCSPHVVDMSALSICIVLCAFVVVIHMRLLYVNLGSRVRPSILGLMFMGSVMLPMCSLSCALYSDGSGVKRVHDVLSGLRMRLFVHVCISCRYDWMFVFAMFISLCVDAMVMSS